MSEFATLKLNAAASAFHRYQSFVKATTRIAPVPRSALPWERIDGPFIALTWGDEPILTRVAFADGPPMAILVSDCFAGRIVAEAARRAGFGVISGTGTRERPTIDAREPPVSCMLRDALKGGTSLLLYADEPSQPRQMDPRLLRVAWSSGRPIFLFAAIPSSRIALSSRSCSVMALPFGRACVLWSGAIYVPQDAGETELALIAARIETELDRLEREARRRLASDLS